MVLSFLLPKKRRSIKNFTHLIDAVNHMSHRTFDRVTDRYWVRHKELMILKEPATPQITIKTGCKKIAV
jgi:hypothetical protein